MFAQVAEVPPALPHSTPMQLRLIKRRKKIALKLKRAHLSLEPEILQLMIVVMLGGQLIFSSDPLGACLPISYNNNSSNISCNNNTFIFTALQQHNNACLLSLSISRIALFKFVFRKYLRDALFFYFQLFCLFIIIFFLLVFF